MHKLLIPLAFLLLGASPPRQPILLTPGPNNDGRAAPPFVVLSTELNSLPAGGTVVESTNIFSTAQTGGASTGKIALYFNITGEWTGAHFVCWFLPSINGSTFESSTSFGESIASRSWAFHFDFPENWVGGPTGPFTLIDQEGLVPLPTLPFKVLCINAMQAFPASGSTITIIPLGEQAR
jgi:hypothetical protein